ncbi:MAG TPA: hypothetical protein VFL16_08260 [Steroidobacteraceae bacterium]|nr:hypothetical protein [Steroidobacteraceae bacterium]
MQADIAWGQRMDAQHHSRLVRFAVAVLGAWLAWGLWQGYGDWLFAPVAAHVA